MPFFYQIVTISTRLPPPDVEARLRQVADDRQFAGSIGGGRFKLTRLAEAPDDISSSTVRKPPVRGSITPDADGGSQIRMLFCDPFVSGMTVVFGIGSLLFAFVDLRAFFAAIAVVALAVWACHWSLNENVVKSTQIIRRCVSGK